VRFFWYKSPYALNPSPPAFGRSGDLRRGRQSSPPCPKEEAERIAIVLTLVGIRRLIVLSIVRLSGLKNE
jgi:hypothetical protein